MLNIVIIGATNSGKTSLFNKLTNTSVASVNRQYNYTTDFNYGLFTFHTNIYLIIDTSSLLDYTFLWSRYCIINNYSVIYKIQKKFFGVLKKANIIILIYDINKGIQHTDIAIYKYLLSFYKYKNIYILFNKIDLYKSYICCTQDYLQKFYNFFVTKIYLVSINTGLGITDFLWNLNKDRRKCIILNKKKYVTYIKNILSFCINIQKYYKIYVYIMWYKQQNIHLSISNRFHLHYFDKKIIYFHNFRENKDIKNISKINIQLDHINGIILGRPNVGKSTLLNIIVQQDRSIVADIPFTTRDFIFNNININNIYCTIIDTPGVTKKNLFIINKEQILNILNFQILIYIIDITIGIVHYDLVLINYFYKKGKLLIIVFNKCDLYQKINFHLFLNILYKKYSFLRQINIYFLSIKYSNILNIYYWLKNILATYIYNIKINFNSNYLTKILFQAMSAYNIKKQFLLRTIKLKYAHLGGYYPLTIVIHGNKINLLNVSYKRFLVTYYIKSLNLLGLYLRIKFKEIINPYKITKR